MFAVTSRIRSYWAANVRVWESNIALWAGEITRD